MSAEPTAVQRKIPDLDDLKEVYHRASAPDSSLCARCLELRLEEALGNIEPPGYFTRRRPALAVKIADVGRYYRQESNYSCKLCHLLSLSRVTVKQPGKSPQDCEDGDELYVFELCEDLSCSLRPSFRRGGVLRGQSSLYLAVVPSGFTRNDEIMELHGERNGFLAIRRRGAPQPRLFVPQVVSPVFNLSLARHWLHYCKKHHQRLCSRKSKRPTNLHLIDCLSREVIPAPYHADYTALSYVWGMPTTAANPSGSTIPSGYDRIPLPSPVPTVITDAICVTLGLGFRYLWVDRYCIDQDSHSKHQQINQMDLIYQHAELTIIAAAGNDPEFGLPGIISRARCGQHMPVTVGDFDIIPTLRHPHVTIQSSRWSTRGWTFQESALSRRNLCFTDDQVYFECKAMNCHESLSSDLDTLHMEDKSQFMEILRAGLFGGTEKLKYGHFDDSNMQPTHKLLRFMGMVEQYTARDLTYDTDSLNAFIGIIRSFAAPETSLGQICGVPFLIPEDYYPFVSFLDGLGWSHKAPACDAHNHPKRRPEFPSWSWAGWAGEIEYERRSHNGEPQRLVPDRYCSVSIDTGDGLRSLPLTNIEEAKGLSQGTIEPDAIYLEAQTLPASAFSYDTFTSGSTLQVFRYPGRLALSVGPWGVSHFLQSLQNADERQCSYIGRLGNSIVIMVLEAQDDSWSRVGLIYLDGVSYLDFGKSLDEFTGKSRAVYGPIRKGVGNEFASFRVI